MNPPPNASIMVQKTGGSNITNIHSYSSTHNTTSSSNLARKASLGTLRSNSTIDDKIRGLSLHTVSGSESARNASYTIKINDPKTNKEKAFPSNYIRTTKYTILTFLPKNLFEQFRRVSNFYFLIVVILQLIPEITPLIPITSILPLAFVLVVSGAKEALEDYGRYKADQKNNHELFKVIREGQLQTVFSQSIEVGEIVYVANGQHFPADLILMSSSNDDGICYVETANLDGETNLKIRKALDSTAVLQEVDELAQLKGVIQCEVPNERLYRFNGRLLIESHNSSNHGLKDKERMLYSLNHTMFLQRGAQLRNTKYCYGVCVYAGVDTKLFLNQQPPPSKFSTVERLLNKFVFFIFAVQILICLLCAILSSVWDAEFGNIAWYIGAPEYSVPLYGVRNFFTYFVLYNTMIPISLWVTLEIVKVAQAQFMQWDEFLGAGPDGNGETAMKCKTSNLNEDLGRIQHIFSDKTGTLTENIMSFCKCSVRLDVFDEKLNPGSILASIDYPTTSSDQSEYIKSFLRVLALCHTVVTEIDSETNEISYQSQSPDETALVDTARNNGFVFVKRKADEITIREQGMSTTYGLLAILEFSSMRRRMSVIVRTLDGRIKLLTKGADIVMFERLSEGVVERQVKDETLRQLKLFSREGYRTLVLAERELSLDEFNEWRVAFHQANTAIDNREEKVENVCELIERDLTLLGCTAIEDKLQDQVPETIHYLLESGIQLWVLTGDKQETAINIGYSSRLLNPSMDLIIVNAESSEMCGELLKQSLEKVTSQTHSNFQEFGLVIDGHSLGFALHDHVQDFLTLGKHCRSVICCRVTPLQKALVVRVVKQGEQKISLAIGDGANDVSMIIEAHVGVGIFGKEGTQAARASDYAIHQFKYLQRLLCSHGRYSYIRVTGLIQYSFYKNLCFTLGLFWFSIFNGFTGQSLYDAWIITFYNIVFTSIPPLLYGIFEKDLNSTVIEQHPQVYRSLQAGKLFTQRSFSFWLIAGLWHSVVVYFGSHLIFESEVLKESGITADIWTFGFLASTIAVVLVNLRMALELRTWNVLHMIGVIGSILCYFLLLLFRSVEWPPQPTYDVLFQLFTEPLFYFAFIVLPVLALLPDFAVKYYARQYFPTDWQILREKYRRKDLVEFKIGSIETF